MNTFIHCMNAFFACAGFCIVFNLKNIKVAAVASFGGALGWYVYLVTVGVGSDITQNLLASIAIALFSEIMARVFKTPATVFMIIGILPLVPGGGIYYTMEYCVNGNTAMFLEKGLHTFAIAGAIAVGVSLGSSIVRIYTAYKRNMLKKESCR